MVQKDLEAQKALKAKLVHLDKMEQTELMVKTALEAQKDQRVHKEFKEILARMVKMALEDQKAQKAHRVFKEILVRMAKMEQEAQKAHKVLLEQTVLLVTGSGWQLENSRSGIEWHVAARPN